MTRGSGGTWGAGRRERHRIIPVSSRDIASVRTLQFLSLTDELDPRSSRSTGPVWTDIPPSALGNTDPKGPVASAFAEYLLPNSSVVSDYLESLVEAPTRLPDKQIACIDHSPCPASSRGPSRKADILCPLLQCIGRSLSLTSGGPMSGKGLATGISGPGQTLGGTFTGRPTSFPRVGGSRGRCLGSRRGCYRETHRRKRRTSRCISPCTSVEVRRRLRVAFLRLI